jgi:hypothetical protein
MGFAQHVMYLTCHLPVGARLAGDGVLRGGARLAGLIAGKPCSYKVYV